MKCARCARELPAGFPGATIACACGASTTLPDAPAVPRTAGAGPYRASPGQEPSHDLVEMACPYCGIHCSPMQRVCPRCDVRFDSVRCARCYTLQPPGSFACARCGEAIALQPLLDATDAPCPRCKTPLEAAGGEDARVHECPRCGGMFVPRDALAEILCRAEVNGPWPEAPPARVARLDPVKYLPCPLCHTSMNRTNFGRSSGVIVDVCRAHGTWFDAGELTRVVAFASAGGLAKTRAREQREEKERARDAVAVQLELAGMTSRREMGDRLQDWELLLRDLFFS